MSGTLLGPKGQPMAQYLEAQDHAAGRPKNPKPIIGDAYGAWGGLSQSFNTLPGGGLIAFDTSRLQAKDYRKMREHYQIGSSLHLLTFMLHQLDWEVVCEDKKVQAWCEYNLSTIWTRLVRSLCSAFVFGYSANALEWENDVNEGKLRLNKIKDLLPDECEVSWDYVESALKTANTVAPKVPIFDGIKQRGSLNKIEVSNSLWYPLLMENGNYYGRKLLNSAFQPWFFSSLIHLYQNKYFERFGEPVPIARAPFNEKVQVGDKTMYGYDLMGKVLSNVRSRSAAILPNSRSKEGLTDQPEYDYQIEYLESQMRGADFERYLQRLDEEMSLALFQPLMVMRTSESGGQNQGSNHTQLYLWMLNAVAGDWTEYIDKYVLRPMAIYNFGVKAKLPRIKFRKMGVVQQETLRAIIQTLIQKDKVKFDAKEIGDYAGLTLEEVEELDIPNVQDPNDPLADPNAPDDSLPEDDKRVGRPERLKNGDGIKANSTTKQISQRIQDQATRVYRKRGKLEDFLPTLGHTKQLAEDVAAAGHADVGAACGAFQANVLGAVADISKLGYDVYPTAQEFNAYVDKIVNTETEKLYANANS